MNEFNPYRAASDVGSDPSFFDGEGFRLATRGERFLAAVIDFIIQMIFIFPLALGLGLYLALTTENQWTIQILSQLGGGLITVLVFLVLNGYLLASHGQTIGKLLLKTRIVDRDTNRILPFWPLILKRYSWLWISGVIPVVGMVVWLVDALLIFRDTRACLHDDVAGTKVIKV